MQDLNSIFVHARKVKKRRDKVYILCKMDGRHPYSKYGKLCSCCAVKMTTHSVLANPRPLDNTSPIHYDILLSTLLMITKLQLLTEKMTHAILAQARYCPKWKQKTTSSHHKRWNYVPYYLNQLSVVDIACQPKESRTLKQCISSWQFLLTAIDRRRDGWQLIYSVTRHTRHIRLAHLHD